MTLVMQILVDGFVISSLYALGAIGFTIIFGVSGVLNLAHGGILVVAAMVAWYMGANLGLGVYPACLVGILAGIVMAYLTYYLVVSPIERSRRIPAEEKEIFILTATLLWGIMIQEMLAYIFSSNPISVPRLVPGITNVFGVHTPTNELAIGVVSWLVILGLWFFVNKTRFGKAILAASINPRGVSLLGFELSSIHRLVWGLYGLLAGLAGVLLATFIGASPTNVGDLTASAFIIVILGGLGSVPGSLLAAYIIGFIETLTAYLSDPSYRTLPALFMLIIVIYLRPQGLFGRR